MTNSTMEFVKFGGWLVSLGMGIGGTVAWVKVKIKSHDERITKVEGKFTTDGHEPRFITCSAHDHICSRANDSLIEKIGHVVDMVTQSNSLLKDLGKTVGDLSVQVAVFEETREKKDEKQ